MSCRTAMDGVTAVSLAVSTGFAEEKETHALAPVTVISTPIPRQAEGMVRSLYGANREQRNHLHYGNTFDSGAGRFGYLVEYCDRRSEGFKTIDGAPDFTATDRTGFRKHEPMLKLFWEPDTERFQRVDLSLGYTEMVANETYMGLSEEDFAADPFRRYAGSRFDRIDTEQFRSHLRHQIEVWPEWLLTTTVYYHELERNWYKERTTGADIADPQRLAVLKGEAAGELRYRANQREYASGGIQAVAQYTLNGDRVTHNIEAGVRLHEDYVRRFQRDDTASLDEESAFSGGSRGSRAPYVPEVQLMVGSGLETERWGAFVDVIYVDAAYTTASNVRAPVDPQGNPNSAFGKTDAHVVVDLSGRLRLNEAAWLTGSVHNLFDKTYIAARHPAGPRPGAPRTVLAGVEVRF